MLDVMIFNIGLGQCIFMYPRNDHDYGLMLDCGNKEDLEPIDFLIEKKFLSYNENRSKYILSNLTLTNFDQDHFSGLPTILKKVHIKTTCFPKNLTSDEIKKSKTNITQAMRDVTHLLDTYTNDADWYNPPFFKKCFYLEKNDFENGSYDTNKLSQLVFIKYQESTMCIPGDLPKIAWEKHLENPTIQNWLKITDIFVASHHGHEDGYCGDVFSYCSPECIILSDKFIQHSTQEGMATLYANKVSGNGITFNGNSTNLRKTLTTRNDGNIWIRCNENEREYNSFIVD